MLRAIVEFSLRFRGIVIALACLTALYGIYATEQARLGVFPDYPDRGAGVVAGAG